MTCKDYVGKRFVDNLDSDTDTHDGDNTVPVSWMLGEDPPVCWNCNKKVPDPIQTIMNLHEWDTPDAK